MNGAGVSNAAVDDYDSAAPSPSKVRLLPFLRRPFIVDILLYGLCSAGALALDWGTLTLLAMRGVPPLWASAIGFCLGMISSYTASITFIFRGRRALRAATEASLFVAIGLAGLVLTQILLWFALTKLDLSAPLAKGPTAIAVFLFNFLARRALIFARPGT